MKKTRYFWLVPVLLCIPLVSFATRRHRTKLLETAYLGAKRVCEVHHVPLLKDVIPITYGLVGLMPGEELMRQRTLFPNSKTRVLGGCVISAGSPSQAEVLFCNRCRRAEQAWRVKDATSRAKQAETERKKHLAETMPVPTPTHSELIPMQSDGSTLIEGYRIPSLPGWWRLARSAAPGSSPNRDVTPDIQAYRRGKQPFVWSSVSDLDYRKTLAGQEQVSITFHLYVSSPEAKPYAAQELAEDVQREVESAERRGLQVMLAETTHYRGHPAHLRRMTWTLPGGGFWESEILEVAHGKDRLVFSRYLSTGSKGDKTFSPLTRATASNAWRTVTGNLKYISATRH